jgi:hypothetical protein
MRNRIRVPRRGASQISVSFLFSRPPACWKTLEARPKFMALPSGHTHTRARLEGRQRPHWDRRAGAPVTAELLTEVPTVPTRSYHDYERLRGYHTRPLTKLAAARLK